MTLFNAAGLVPRPRIRPGAMTVVAASCALLIAVLVAGCAVQPAIAPPDLTPDPPRLHIV